jgi:hypothetical protein
VSKGIPADICARWPVKNVKHFVLPKAASLK